MIAKIEDWFERQKAGFERSFPWIVAVATASAYWWFVRTRVPAANVKELLQAALNIAAIGVGFLISAKAVLLSISSSRVVRALRKEGVFGCLVGYFISGTWWGVAAATISGALLWLDFQKISPSKELVLAGWLFACGGAAGATARVVWLFSKLVRQAAEEKV